MSYSGKVTGDTEEIFLDEEEFEAMLAAESMPKEVEPPFEEELIYLEEDADIEYEEDDDGIEYEEDDDDIEYEEEYDEEDDADVVNIFSGGLGDKLIYLTGALVILFALIVGVVLITGKTRKAVVGPDMSEIGKSVAAMNLIGEEGINNVFGHEATRLTDLYEAAESFEYSEIDEETGLVNVNLSLTSILKDLKIKFVNRNNKLVANVPFQAEVTDSKGNTATYTDDDKDGMIYLTDLAGGEYSVSMLSLSGFDALYSFSSEKASINVKSQIEYAKVDVSNEVKSESQVDVKTEDTKVQETVVEAKLTDTVEYVMSSKAPLTDESGYTEVKKDTIKDPVKQYTSKDSAKASSFKKLDTSNNDPEPPAPTFKVDGISVSTSLKSGDETSASVGVTITGNGSVSDVAWSSSDDSVVSVKKNSSDPTKAIVKAQNVSKKATATITAKVTFSDGTSGSATSDTITVSPSVDQSKLSVSASIGTLYPGSTFDIVKKGEITVTDKDGKKITDYSLSFKSSKESVATVSGSGVITAVAEGKTKITVTCSANNMTTSSVDFDVTVSATKIAIKLNYKSKTIFLGDKESFSLKATVTGFEKNSEVSWKSSDESIVTVASDGTLTPVKEGSAQITCTSKEAKAVKATCDIKVVLHPSQNKVSLLKDKEGNQIYVYDANTKKYVEAKYADYYSGVKLFKATAVEYKYMGWWTIGGKTYYFDKNGKKVTGEQVILGTKYSFASDGSLISGNGTFGIDVSKWNGTIDWTSVSKSGVSYAIIRSGFRGSTEGGLIEDAKFATNIKNATAAGLKVGVYFFTQATNEVEAIEEASMVLGQVSGYTISYPIFIDVESAGSGARAEGLTNMQRTAVIKAFCQTISNSGYTAGVYANKTWFTSKINTNELTAYKIWLAQYNTSVTYNSSRYDLWQYTSSGSLSGISGDVDFDLSYLGY